MNIMLLSKFNKNPPAQGNSIRDFESESGIKLPTEYVQFLEASDGGEGFLGEAYLILWRIGELKEMNKAYQVAEYAPGLLLFGSDGGGEAFAFDLRSGKSGIVSVPFVGMELSLARPLAENFDSFLEALSKT